MKLISACIGIVFFFPFYQKYISNGDLQLIPSAVDWIYLAILGWVCSVYAYSQ